MYRIDLMQTSLQSNICFEFFMCAKRLPMKLTPLPRNTTGTKKEKNVINRWFFIENLFVSWCRKIHMQQCYSVHSTNKRKSFE